MMCIAKAITNGYFPFGATMISDAVAEVFETSGAEGFIGHGYTYSAHHVGAAGAVACLAETKRLQVKDNAAARGTQLYEGMLRLQEKHDLIGRVRGGHGLMTAIELVSDRSTKAAMSPDIVLNVQEFTFEKRRHVARIRPHADHVSAAHPLRRGCRDDHISSRQSAVIDLSGVWTLEVFR